MDISRSKQMGGVTLYSSDRELGKNAKDDIRAFSSLYELNYKRIFNYILYSTRDIEVALDLTSETFLKALQAIERYDHTKGTFSAWVYRIASREIAMYWRRLNTVEKHAASRISFHDDAVKARNRSTEREIDEAWHQLENSDDFIAIAPYLCKLPGKYREVVFLRYFEDRSLEDTAGILGRPAGAVKAQCHRGLKLLKKWMQRSEEQAPLESEALNTILEKGP